MVPPREAIVRSFRLAAAAADVVALTTLLDPDVVALTDSAGDVIAPTTPLHGPAEVIREVLAHLSAESGASVTEYPVNAALGLVVRSGGRVVAIVNLGISAGLVTHVWITRSPQKLQRWNVSP